MYIRAGGSMSLAGITASAEVDYLLSGALMASLGAEYWFLNDHLGVRAGYHYGDAAKAIPSYASLGLGAKFAGISFDFAYLLGSSAIGGSLCFGLGYSF